MKSIEHAQRQEAMAHSEAVRMHAAEKIYPWRTFPGVTRGIRRAFLACVACALEVKAAAAFVDNACDVLRQPAE